jgi:hypothetical protein
MTEEQIQNRQEVRELGGQCLNCRNNRSKASKGIFSLIIPDPLTNRNSLLVKEV